MAKMNINIDELVKLTDEQKALAKQMEDLYKKMQEANMAFALNENGEVVVYNSEQIADCTDPELCGSAPEGFEYADVNSMYSLFPVWTAEDLCLQRK